MSKILKTLNPQSHPKNNLIPKIENRVKLVVEKEMEKIMRNFLWKGADGEGGDHLVPRKMVVRPKIKGGLVIWRLKERNKALLFKWLWTFPLEQETLGTKVIKSKFGLHSNRWENTYFEKLFQTYKIKIYIYFNFISLK